MANEEGLAVRLVDWYRIGIECGCRPCPAKNGYYDSEFYMLHYQKGAMTKNG